MPTSSHPAPEPTRREASPPDAIDRQLEVWARELPTLDLETEGIVERLWKLARYVERTTNETVEEFGLSFGEWRLLGHLRYSGAPYHGKPGKLAEALGLSSGAMTNRLDALQRRGLLRRLSDPDDRRGVIVELTEQGHGVWEAAVGAQAEKEALVASALEPDERAHLNDLLRRLMHAFQEQHGPAPKKPLVPDA